jgi:hypothetical protein
LPAYFALHLFVTLQANSHVLFLVSIVYERNLLMSRWPGEKAFKPFDTIRPND